MSRVAAPTVPTCRPNRSSEMFDKWFFEKWSLPIAGLIVGAIIVFGIVRGMTQPG